MPGSGSVAADDEGDAGVGHEHDGGAAGGQAVEAVGEVHRVGEAEAMTRKTRT